MQQFESQLVGQEPETQAPARLSGIAEQQAPAGNALTSAEADELLNVLRAEAKARKKKHQMILIGILLYVTVMLSIIAFVTLKTGEFPSPMMSLITNITAFLGVFGAISPRHKDALARIAKLDDVRAVGPLAGALGLENKDLRNLAESALLRLLPRVQASDATYIDADQMGQLITALNGKRPRLMLPILKALEQVGDERAVPAVQRIADHATGRRWSAEVQMAARYCLPALMLRAERKRSSAELLRASGASDVSSDLLVRPAMSAPSASDPSVLPRPSAMPGHEREAEPQAPTVAP